MTKPQDDSDDSQDIDLEQILKDVLVPLLDERDKQLKLIMKQQVEESVKAATPKPVEPSTAGENVSPEVKALQTKLAAMEKKAAEDELRAEQDKLDNAVSDIVQSFGTDEVKVAKLALKDMAGEIIKASDGSYITKDGKSLKDVATEFFNSGTGQRLLPANQRQGTGTPSGKPQRPDGQKELSTDEMLVSVFGR